MRVDEEVRDKDDKVGEGTEWKDWKLERLAA